MTKNKLSEAERYLEHALMKAGHNQSQIANLLDWRKSTISRGLSCIIGSRGYCPKQSVEIGAERLQHRLNAYSVSPWGKGQANALLRLQWSPEQFAYKLPLSQHQHIYADKALGDLAKNLTTKKQEQKLKLKRIRYVSGRDRRGQITNRRLLSERTAQINGRTQVGHWECETDIGTNRKQAIVTVVERKRWYAVMTKVSKKMDDRVGKGIINALKPFKVRTKTVTYQNSKKSAAMR